MKLGWITGATAGTIAMAAVVFTSLAHGQAPAVSPTPATGPAPAAASPPAPALAPTLTKADVDTWLDGMMPYALSSGDVAGAVVVVVKDGQVLTQRGFGYADVKAKKPVDPATTLFRPGSVSKTFTWTAVMQLVQAGKIDLDTDINTYLDFKIPPYQGKPITMRNLMTHTPGFEETLKHEFVAGNDRLMPIGAYLKLWTPTRIFAPGTTSAYSNYGATIAGYIVERLSGEPFDSYVQNHIFGPLGMTHATFDQPLPARLAPDMATGYSRASEPPKPFELINVGPAGSLSASGGDMARFMIAHLEHGRYGSAQILSPETEALMQAPQPKLIPGLNGMALGFYHEDMNGHVVVGHAGDTEYFHSDMHLLANDDVGLFISMNSAGKDGAAHPIRAAFFQGFMDRYYPVPAPTLPTASTAKDDAKAMVGLYWSSRRVSSSFFDITNLLGQAKVTADKDGIITVSALTNTAHAPKHWREVGPFLWHDDASGSTLSAVVDGGKVTGFASSDLPPVLVFQPVPGWARSSWNTPAILVSLLILAAAVVLWPVQILVRRRYGQSFTLAGRDAWLYRGVRLVALFDLLGVIAYFMIFNAMEKGITAADVGMDPWIRLAQFFCLIGVVGVLVAAWNAVAVWSRPGRSWWARVSCILLLLATIDFAWIALSLHLITPTLNY